MIGMKILITGGAGLVGSHCAEYFAKNGYEVVIFDNLMRSKLFGYNKESVEYNWNYLGKFKNIKRILGDVRNEEDLKKAINKGVDVVIHTAAQPGVPSSVRMPGEDFNINALGTLKVLECLRQISPQATFIYTSTNKVYGENVDKFPILEKKTRYVFKNIKGISESLPTDLTGHTPYGVSKLVGDLYTQEYAHIYGMKTGVFRMSCIYGIRQFGFEDQGWVAWFVIATFLKKPITIYGDGKQVRDLLYVTDLVEAFEKFIKSDVRHEVFNIGGGQENTLSLIEMVKFLEKKTKTSPKINFSEWRPSDQRVYISDITKVSRVLKWKPKVNPEEGIERLLFWVKKNLEYFK
ncbi:MAG: GDP-mannose 4,6-dehydratase [Candidatus Omnitrophica bacterium]|nr:GDP-mannose 4,6-dehydratase [Candidatus Omnitrophota bacterium]